MRSDRGQLDIFDHSAQRMTAANRAAAEHAQFAHNFPPSVREERVKHYTSEAERYEAIAAQVERKAP